MGKILCDKMIKVTYVAALFLVSGETVEYSEQNEGYAQGFMPVCPGASNPAEIKPEHLDKIKILVLGNGSFINAKWTTYKYHNVRDLARHPDIDFSRRTLMYVPGYLEANALPIGRNLGQLYRELGYNVLLLDYLAFTMEIFPVATRKTRPVGKHVAEMLANLTTLGLDPKKLELVGVSLGGQTISFIAKNYYRITGSKISFITALDPTGPCFRHLGQDQRLDPSDADFVLMIATNTGGYGIATPAGHMTVYVNGGEFQPGLIRSVVCDDICSHLHGYFIWMSAVMRPGAFIAMQCDSVQQARDHKCLDRKPMVTNTLDLYTDRRKPGIYYLATSNSYPFYLGKRGLKRSATILSYIRSLNAADVLRV